MTWIEFNTLDEFQAWNESMNVKYNLPQPSRNQATGEIDESAQATVTYTDSFEVEGKWIAEVEDADSDGLTITTLRRPQPVREVL
jgi:hypothetical protein